MTSQVSTHRPELDNFLFAALGEEQSGMMLTVVSALGRLGLDPWKEADRLADMPRTGAVQRLAPMIAAIPEGPWKREGVEAIAARLIALLPSPVTHAVVHETKPRPILWLACAALIGVVALTMANGDGFSPSKLFGSAPQAGVSAGEP
jgi:hypothetical protein